MNYGSNGGGQNCNGYTTFYQTGTELLDVDGDGYTDVLEQDRNATDHWFLLKNNQNGTVTTSSYLDAGDGDITRILTGDFNGDGWADLYIQHLQEFQQSNGDGTFKRVSFTTDSSTNTKLFAADFDGDGCTDILANGSTNKIYYACSPAPPATINNWIHNGYEITLADFNGDGKTDVLVTPDNGTAAQLWLSTGTGLVEVNANVQLGTAYSSGNWGDYSIVTGDWNGDGKADIAIIPKTATNKSYQIYLSTGNGKLVATGVGRELQGSGQTISAVVADWNNDGGPDIWIQYSNTSANDLMERFAFIPITISAVANGVGISSTVAYKPLSDSSVYTKGSGAVFPTQDVVNPLWVVSQVLSSNGVGDLNDNYKIGSSFFYTGGKMDAHGRGFLGFQKIQIDDGQGMEQFTNYCTAFPCTGMVTSSTKVCPQ